MFEEHVHMNNSCCPTENKGSDTKHVLQGARSHVDDLEVYTVGTGASTVVVIPDIFGLLENSLRFIDELATKSGLKFVVVDYFRGKPWSIADFPPKPGQNIPEWLSKTVPPEKVRLDTVHVLARLKLGVNVGVIGFCWGGKHALALHDLFGCVASPHPSWLAVQDVEKMGAKPLCLLPSKDEDPALFSRIEEVMRTNEKNVYLQFDNAQHGWCGARADFEKDGANIALAKETLAKFFRANLGTE